MSLSPSERLEVLLALRKLERAVNSKPPKPGFSTRKEPTHLKYGPEVHFGISRKHGPHFGVRLGDGTLHIDDKGLVRVSPGKRLRIGHDAATKALLERLGKVSTVPADAFAKSAAMRGWLRGYMFKEAGVREDLTGRDRRSIHRCLVEDAIVDIENKFLKAKREMAARLAGRGNLYD